MAGVVLPILVVGNPCPDTKSVLERLFLRGCGPQSADGVTKACETLSNARFHVVLASEILPDGRGYDMAGAVQKSSGWLLVAVALSDTCLWLPTVECGMKVLGERALNMAGLEAAIENILAAAGHKMLRPFLDPVRTSAPLIPAEAAPLLAQSVVEGTTPAPRKLFPAVNVRSKTTTSGTLGK